MAPAGNECYNVFFFDGFYIWFVCISFFGVELGDWFEVVMGPGVMERPGSEAVGIGVEAEKNSELFTSAERWRPTLEVWRAALRVATITQRTCSSIYIAAASSQVFTLLLLKPRHSIQGWTPLALSDGRKNVLNGFIHSLDPLDAISSR